MKTEHVRQIEHLVSDGKVADAILTAFDYAKEGEEDALCTKGYLDKALSKFKLDLQRWLFIALVAQLALIFAIVGLLFNDLKGDLREFRQATNDLKSEVNAINARLPK